MLSSRPVWCVFQDPGSPLAPQAEPSGETFTLPTHTPPYNPAAISTITSTNATSVLGTQSYSHCQSQSQALCSLSDQQNGAPISSGPQASHFEIKVLLMCVWVAERRSCTWVLIKTYAENLGSDFQLGKTMRRNFPKYKQVMSSHESWQMFTILCYQSSIAVTLVLKTKTYEEIHRLF